MSGPRLSREEEAELERALAPMREAFRDKLPARLADLEAGLAAARTGAAGALSEAHRRAHALQGTAGSYGFEAIGLAARAMEECLEPHLGSTPAPDAPLWEQIDAVTASLRGAVAAAHSRRGAGS